MRPSHRFLTHLALVLLCGLVFPPHAVGRDKTSAYVAPLGYRSSACDGTADKPQSKLWFHDGSFWCALDTAEGDQILELVGQEWRFRQTLSGSGSILDGRNDVLWDGEHLFVVVYAEQSFLCEFDYDPEQRLYVLRPGFPLPLDLAPGSETLVIEEDSTGRLWLAYTATGTVYAAHSGDDHLQWNLPGQVLRDSTSNDDISSVIAFDNHIGVFWSDQNRDEFGFRVRADSAAPEHWGAVEVVDSLPGCADDHLHLAADRDGRVYAVTKDDFNRLSVHMRSPSGEWTINRDPLGSDVTRPILMTADEDSLLLVLYTRWHQGLDTIGIIESRMGTLDFSAPAHFIAAPAVNLNNVTGSKRSLPAGKIVAMATGDDVAWWNLWESGETKNNTTDAGHSWPLRAHRMAPCTSAVLALSFDEGEGSQTADAAGGGHGELGGPWAGDFAEPTWTEGISGHALRFDGERQFLSVSTGRTTELSGSMTMECWFRSWPVMRKQVLFSGDRFYLHLQYTGEPKFSWDEARGKNHTVEMAKAASDSSWHHLAYVYDEARQQSRLYLDGVLGEAVADSERVVEDPSSLLVGARLNNHVLTDVFLGCIDQVQITAAVRYVDDFVPQRQFEASGAPITFLQWTPRAQKNPQTYDVFRRSGSQLQQLNAAPLTVPFFYDEHAPEGPLRYELVVHQQGLPPARTSLEWSPPQVPSGSQ